MADILIRGMEKMPGNCRECMFAGFGGMRNELNVCMFSGESQSLISHERMSKCPLVPLPAGYWRLIDAERFRVILCRLKERQNDDVATHALNWAIECLDKMDTIIPAEGGTDECSEN